MSSSAFNAADFLAATTSEEGSTQLTPIPPDTYKAIIGEVTARPWESKKTGKSGISCDIAFDIIDDNKTIEELIGRPPRVTQGYFMDLIPGTMRPDYGKGKSVQLMRVREAVGQNIAGQAWNPKMLEGQVLQIVVVQDPADDNTDTVYTRVKSVAKLG